MKEHKKIHINESTLIDIFDIFDIFWVRLDNDTTKFYTDPTKGAEPEVRDIIYRLRTKDSND